MTIVYVAVLIVAVALGWVAGMLTFRRTSSWCKECGETLECLHCARRTVRAATNGGVHWASVRQS